MPDYVILDNGAAEGHTMSWNQLFNLATTWPVNEVVLPDKLRNAEFSITNALSAKKLARQLRDRGIKLMAVAQGETLAEIMKCIYAYAGMDYISVIGLPRVLNTQFLTTSRLRLAESLANDPDLSGFEIHCLGSHYPFPREVYELAQLPNVRSMDTSMPWVYGMAELSVKIERLRKPIRRVDDYFNAPVHPHQKGWCEENARTLLEWAKAS